MLQMLCSNSSCTSPRSSNTARVEAELMDLWSAVEKEKEARKVRRGGEEAGEIAGEIQGADGDSRVDDVRADEDEDEDDLSAASSQSGSFFSFLAALRAVTRDAAFLLDPRCEDAKPFRVAAALAFFNQATCSTSVVNYAPRVLQPRRRQTESSGAHVVIKDVRVPADIEHHQARQGFEHAAGVEV